MRTSPILLFLMACLLANVAVAQRASIATAEEQDILVERHNYWRQLADASIPNVSWSDELAQAALEWARQLGKTCDMEHSDMDYGENLFWSSTAYPAQGVVDNWASEKADYNYATNKCARGKVCGHYTQIVWRKTTQIGCARVVCKGGQEIWVCEYAPAGNFIGQKPY